MKERKPKTMSKATKIRNKRLKAVYQIHIAINHLNELGVYDYDMKRRKVKSYFYWSSKA